MPAARIGAFAWRETAGGVLRPWSVNDCDLWSVLNVMLLTFLLPRVPASRRATAPLITFQTQYLVIFLACNPIRSQSAHRGRPPIVTPARTRPSTTITRRGTSSQPLWPTVCMAMTPTTARALTLPARMRASAYGGRPLTSPAASFPHSPPKTAKSSAALIVIEATVWPVA